MRLVPATSTSVLACLVNACAGFGPPSDATLSMLPTTAEVRPVRGRFDTTLETPVFAGVYDTVLAVEPGPDPRCPRVRLQLFPDIGGKFLELEVGAAAIDGLIATGAPYACPLPVPDGTPPHLLMILGLALRERFSPIVADRVLGERRDAGQIELSLRPATAGGTVAVRLDETWSGAEWSLDYGWLHITIDAAGTLRARGTEIRFDWADLVLRVSP